MQLLVLLKSRHSRRILFGAPCKFKSVKNCWSHLPNMHTYLVNFGLFTHYTKFIWLAWHQMSTIWHQHEHTHALLQSRRPLSLLLHSGRLTRLHPSNREKFSSDMSVINAPNFKLIFVSPNNQLSWVVKAPSSWNFLFWAYWDELEWMDAPPTTFGD